MHFMLSRKPPVLPPCPAFPCVLLSSLQIQDYGLFQLRDAPGQQKLKGFQQVRGTLWMSADCCVLCAQAYATTRFVLLLPHQCRSSQRRCPPAPSLVAWQARWAARWDRLQLPAGTPQRQGQHRHQAPRRARLQRHRQPLRLAHQPAGRPRRAGVLPPQWQALRCAAHLQRGQRQMRGTGLLRRATLGCSMRSRLPPACAPSATCSSENLQSLCSHCAAFTRALKT